MSDTLGERRLDGRRAFAGRAVAVDVDRVRLADGSEAVREVVRHPGAVVVVPVLDGGSLLLERQFRYAVDSELVELPAGTLRRGEPPEECARRELAEETGYAARRWRPLARFFSAPGFCDEVLHAFLAEGLEPVPGGQRLDADERIELVTVSLAEALAMVERGEIRDAKSIVGVLLAARALAPSEA